MPLNAPDQPVSRHVSQQRLQARLDTLARFGATAKGGVDRPVSYTHLTLPTILLV